MVTQAQTNAFFRNADQMALAQRTQVKLGTEGVTEIHHCGQWNDDDWDQFAKICKSPEQIQDPNGAPGALIAQVPFQVGVMSLKRLKGASALVSFYEATGRTITAANMQWDSVVKNFLEQWKALEEKSKQDDPDVPKLTKGTTVAKWDDSWQVYLSCKFGVRKSTLAYVIRPEVQRAAVEPALVAGQPYSAEHGSIEGEMTARLSHTHPLFSNDSGAVYADLLVAVRGTTYEATLKPFARRNNGLGDGRGAYLALIGQHAGKDKWVSLLRDAKKYISQGKWDGKTSMTLESHVAKIRQYYVDIETAAEHVDEQLPNGRTRVQSFLDSIEGCQDADVAARRAQIAADDTGMGQDFEAAVAHILPVDPVKKKKDKRKSAEISGLGGDLKSGVGPKTGVEIRYYKNAEFRALTQPQRDELLELRESRGSGKGKGGGGKGRAGGGKKQRVRGFSDKKMKGKVAALAKEKFESFKAKYEKEQKEEEEGVRECAAALAILRGSKNDKSSKGGAAVGAVEGGDYDASDLAGAVKLSSILKKRRGS